MKKHDFGKPKPLPGQLGYNTKATDVLEREAKEMEQRLRTLQEKLQLEQQIDAGVPKKGGSRWKSARTDKGSVTNYAKDVQEKYKKKTANEGGVDPMLKATAPNRRAARDHEDNFMIKGGKYHHFLQCFVC